MFLMTCVVLLVEACTVVGFAVVGFIVVIFVVAVVVVVVVVCVVVAGVSLGVILFQGYRHAPIIAIAKTMQSRDMQIDVVLFISVISVSENTFYPKTVCMSMQGVLKPLSWTYTVAKGADRRGSF